MRKIVIGLLCLAVFLAVCGLSMIADVSQKISYNTGAETKIVNPSGDGGGSPKPFVRPCGDSGGPSKPFNETSP